MWKDVTEIYLEREYSYNKMHETILSGHMVEEYAQWLNTERVWLKYIWGEDTQYNYLIFFYSM